MTGSGAVWCKWNRITIGMIFDIHRQGDPVAKLPLIMFHQLNTTKTSLSTFVNIVTIVTIFTIVIIVNIDKKTLSTAVAKTTRTKSIVRRASRTKPDEGDFFIVGKVAIMKR